MQPAVIRTKDFVAEAAEFILQKARRALASRDEFRLALSGGNTPRPVYGELARRGSDLPWEKSLLTFGDERCVPPEDAESNFRMARESLLDPASVPEKSVLRMHGEIDPALAAQKYEDSLQVIAAQRGEKIYRHDLVLLGMGDDGHTASLFPETAALTEKTRTVLANFVPKFQSWRLTFTYPLLNAAREICFLVNSKKNPELIDAILAGEEKYPAARVRPTDGNVTWILGE